MIGIVIDAYNAHERQIRSLLKVAFKVLNIICHGSTNDRLSVYVFMLVLLLCILSHVVSFYDP